MYKHIEKLVRGILILSILGILFPTVQIYAQSEPSASSVMTIENIDSLIQQGIVKAPSSDSHSSLDYSSIENSEQESAAVSEQKKIVDVDEASSEFQNLSRGLDTFAASSTTADDTDPEEEPEYVTYGSLTVGYYLNDGSLQYINQKSASANGKALNYLIKGKKKRTIVLPAEKIEIDRVLWMGSNKTIIADGATIFQTDPDKNIMANDCTSTNYDSIVNVTIQGGTWKIKGNKTSTRSTSTIRFNFASGISLIDCQIDTNYHSHALELIACKDVLVDGCTLKAKGKVVANGLEEALQIDLSTKATAPTVASYGAKYVKGQTCDNITVKNCIISGGRGLCTNKTDTEGGKYLSKYHTNIRLTGNTITGVTSEAAALHNAVGLTVKNNTIISKGSRLDTVYTIGLNIASFGKGKSSLTTSYKNTISGNTIKGGRQGLYIIAYNGSGYGATTVKNNELYCKKGKANAKVIRNTKSLKDSGNHTYTW